MARSMKEYGTIQKITNGKGWGSWPFFIFFALGFFVVYEGNSYSQMAYGAATGAAPSYVVYCTGMLSGAVGALLFHVLTKSGLTAKRGLAYLLFALALAALLVTWFVHMPAVFWAAFALFSVITGLCVTASAYCLYKNMQPGHKTGVRLALAAIVGIFASYAADFVFPLQAMPRMTAMAVAMFVILLVAFKRQSFFELINRQERGYADEGEDRKRFLYVFFTIAFAIVVMSYLIGVSDMAILTSSLSAPGGTAVVPQVLLYFPGILAAGALADAKDGKYLPIVTFVCTLLTAPTAIQVGSLSEFAENSGITYFLGGFFMIYIILSPISIAQRAKNPVLIIVAVVVVYYVFSGLGAVTYNLFLPADSGSLLSIYIAISASLLLAFYLSGELHPRGDVAVAAGPVVTEGAQFNALAQKYRLTNREAEALRLLLDGSSTADIAQTMVVTEHTVQKYIGSMMAKCDAKSRVELITKFAGA